MSYNLLIDGVKQRVSKILSSDNSGHGINHVNRVLNLSLKFAYRENANENIVVLMGVSY